MNIGPFNGLPFSGSVQAGIQTAVSNTDCTASWSDAASLSAHITAETLECLANLTASTYGSQYVVESVSMTAQLDANYLVIVHETGALSCSANLLDAAGVYYWSAGNAIAQASMTAALFVSSGQPAAPERLMIVPFDDRDMVANQ